MIIALNDRHLGAAVKEAPGEVPELRLGAGLPWQERMDRTKALVDAFGAEWISLQFVGYGYDPSGIPWRLPSRLLAMLQGRSMHVMFHELWVGAWSGAGLKERIIGWMQREVVRRLVRMLAPAVMHTSNPAYGAVLEYCGMKADILPLFGAIELRNNYSSDDIARVFLTHGIDLRTEGRSGFWMGAIFGTIHPEWQPKAFFDELANAAKTAGKTVVIIGIGRFGELGDRLWADTARDYEGRLQFILLGIQPAETISCLLQAVDFGISTTPWSILGKSSTGAAMHEHGLPVIVTRDDWQPRTPAPFKVENSGPVLLFQPGMTADFHTFLARRQPPAGKRTRVTETFIRALASS